MSYDLFLATRLKPTEQHVRQVLTAETGFSLDGSFSGGGNILIQTAAETAPLFLLDAPQRADPEELEGVFDALRPRPRWVTFFSVPAAGGERGVAVARTLAQALSNEWDGVVYDPQTEEFLRAGEQREARKELPSTRISTVEIEWFMAMSHLSAETARAFLEVADRRLPQVTPKKRDAFVTWAGGDSHTRYGDFFNWHGRKPCFTGSGYVRRDPDYPAPAVRAWRLSLTLNEEIIRKNRKIRTSAVDLFTSVARELETFYAAAYVQREWILQGRSLLSDRVTEQASRVFIPTWGGLPRQAMWLSWLGPPYRDLVALALDSEAVQVGNGLFLRMGELPADPDELSGRFPHLPDSLTQDSRPIFETIMHANGKQSHSYSARHDIAEYIPPLT